MDTYSKNSAVAGRNILISLSILTILTGGVVIFDLGIKKTETELTPREFSGVFNEGSLAVIQKNTLLPISNPSNPEPQVTQKIRVVITAYSSTIDQTDLDPFVTAAGTIVRDGVVANNMYPFGTKIRIPEIYGDKVFVVEDRMNRKKGYYHIDIWFASYGEAKNFGVKRTHIEILEG